MAHLLLIHLAGWMLRSIAIAAVAGMVALCIRSVAVRHAVWVAVLSSTLLVPFEDMLTPAQLVPAPIEVSVPFPIAHWTGISANQVRAASVRQPERPSVPAIDGWQIAAGVYVCVAILLLVRLGTGYRKIFYLKRTTVAVTEALRNSAEVSVLSRSLPFIGENKIARVPITIGFLRPMIILPSDWRNWDNWTLKAVVSHELTHVRRADFGIALLAAVGACIFWINPLSWWLKHHLRVLSEEASDEAVLASNGNPQRYAEVLLQFAAALRNGGGQRLHIGGVSMARPNVKSRIDRILTIRRPSTGILTKTGWILVLLTAAPVIYTAAVTHINPVNLSATLPIGSPAIATREVFPQPAAKHTEQAASVKPAQLARAKQNAPPRSSPPPEQFSPIPEVVRSVTPVYPQVAIDNQATGMIVVEVKIGADGKPAEVKGMSGHPQLVAASVDAVKQWLFVAGTPASIRIPFIFELVNGPRVSLPTGLQKAEGGRSTAPGLVPEVITRVEPVIPEDVKKFRIQGKVMLSVMIGPDGRPTSVEVLTGHPLMKQPAMDAVRQWVFASGTTEPVKISLPFTYITGSPTGAPTESQPPGRGSLVITRGGRENKVTIEIVGLQGKANSYQAEGGTVISDEPASSSNGVLLLRQQEVTCRVRMCAITSALASGSTYARTLGLNETSIVPPDATTITIDVRR